MAQEGVVSEDACETKLWDLSCGLEHSQGPCQTFPGAYTAVLSQNGDRLLGTLAQKLEIYSIETGQAISSMEGTLSWAQRKMPEAIEPGACWSPCEDLILNDNVLWDPRAPHALHSFDKLTVATVPSGYFNPCGTEVIIDQGIWDLRTFKLVKTCPYFQYASLLFSNDGRAIYAFPREEPRVPPEINYFYSPYQAFFHTVDAVDYSLIRETRCMCPIWAFATDGDDTSIAIIQGDSDLLSQSCHCRMYYIGNHDPTEPQSSLDDKDDDDDSESDSRSGGSMSDEYDDDDDDDEDDYDDDGDFVDDYDFDPEGYDDGMGDDGFLPEFLDVFSFLGGEGEEESAPESSHDEHEDPSSSISRSNDGHHSSRHSHSRRRRRHSRIDFEEEPASPSDPTDDHDPSQQ